MKRTLFFITCVLTSITMLAQDEPSDYLPFVELGKQWHVVISSPNNPNYCRSEKYWMYEEVERNGKTYAHTGLHDDVLATWQEAGLYREENRRVYKYDEITDREIMLYDFSLKEGDIFIYEDFNPSVNCKVLKQGWLEDGPEIVTSCTLNPDNTWDIRYRRLRTWTIGCDNGSGEYNELVTWVESVGTLDNMFCPFCTGAMSCLAYIERKDNETDYHKNEYLPFSFYNIYGPVYGCNLPTGAENNEENDGHHRLTYEQEGDRLHVYGDVFTQCGPNNYAYFYEKSTEDPLVHKIEFEIREVEPLMDCKALHATNFYVPVPGFDPNMNYIIVDNYGEEKPVINKTPQMVYRPFVEDDKVWKVGALNSGNPVQWVEYLYFEGDTIIDGKACKQMMRQRYVSPDFPEYDAISQHPSLKYVGAWYEEDKKVYKYNTTLNQFTMMYDFSLEEGGIFQKDGLSYVIGPRQTGGINGFKGVYRDVMMCGEGGNTCNTTWLESVGNIDGPIYSVYLGKEDHALFLMACAVGDELIYFNDEYEDGATPESAGARKHRFDFTHTTKIEPKTRTRSEAELSLYGEYNEQQLSIHLDPIYDAYLVSIIDESGKVTYEKTINAGNIVGLNIDISSYSKGNYAVTVENDYESFTGTFEAQTTGIMDVRKKVEETGDRIYNLQGQRLNSLQKGLNIVNGQKVFVK